MKTDIMQSLGSGADVKPGRMDGTKNRCSNGKSTGFAMEQKSAESTSFRKVLKEVVEGNRSAEKSTRAVLKTDKGECRSSSDDGGEKVSSADDAPIENGLLAIVNSMVENETMPLSGAENVDSEEGSVIIDEERADAALEIMMETFTELSEVLGIQLIGNTDQFTLREVSSETTEQLAEVIYVIKKLTEGMEARSAEGLPLDIAGAPVDADTLKNMTDTLRTAGFKIELACTVLGVSEAVQQEVAQKMEQFSGQGILQATNPQDLVMSSQHTDRIFGRMYDDTSAMQQLSVLVDNVKKMFAGAAGGQPTITLQATSKEATAELSETSLFDSKVYRALLKIDAMQKSGNENKAAAQGEADILLVGDSPLIVAESLGGEVSGDESVAMASIGGVKSAADLSTGSPKLVPDALMRTTEESVTKQVADKLQSVIRAGLSEVRIQLRPESLGEVKMRIRMEGDVVLAHIEVQNQQVKEIMERNFGSLKDALAQHNITAGAFDVQVGSNNGRHGGAAQQNGWFDEENEGHADNRESQDDKRQPGEEPYTQNTETGRRYGRNSVEYFG